MLVAVYLIAGAKIYAVIGVAVAAAFLTFGIDGIDKSATGIYSFRPLLLPGLVLLWPLVLWRWRELDKRHSVGAAHPIDRPPLGVHAVVWRRLAFVLPLIVCGALLLKATQPPPQPPVRLSAPSEGSK